LTGSEIFMGFQLLERALFQIFAEKSIG